MTIGTVLRLRVLRILDGALGVILLGVAVGATSPSVPAHACPTRPCSQSDNSGK